MKEIKRDEYLLQLHERYVYLRLAEGSKLTIDMVRRMTFDRLKLQNNKTYPILVDARGVRKYFSLETGRYTAGKEANNLLSRVAVLVADTHWMHIFKIYLAINPSAADLSVFLKEEDALSWLLEHVTV